MENFKKPQIIYSLPRTRSTAILYASHKKIKLFEPFGANNILTENLKFNYDGRLHVSKLPLFEQKRIKCLYTEIEYKMNHPESIVKILPSQLFWLSDAENWFKQVIKNNSHLIFVVNRDLSEICWSIILAQNYGWFKHQEKFIDQNKYITVTEKYFINIKNQIEDYLKYFPRGGVLLDFDNLPKNFFDESKIPLLKQDSLAKINKIKNFKYCVDQIENIVTKYDHIIKENISQLKRI